MSLKVRERVRGKDNHKGKVKGDVHRESGRARDRVSNWIHLSGTCATFEWWRVLVGCKEDAAHKYAIGQQVESWPMSKRKMTIAGMMLTKNVCIMAPC